MGLQSRVLEFIKYKGFTTQKFEQLVGLSNAAVSKMGDNTRVSTIDKISNTFPEINLIWLKTGVGTMLHEEEETQTEKDVSDSNNIDTLVREEQSGRRMIPFYDAETTGGYNGRVGSSNTAVTLQGYINAGDWFAGRETAAIRHVGDSMVEYPDGCVLAVKEVREFRLLVPGRNYVVETDEYRITKRIQKGHSADYIALYSSNQEKYDDGRLVYEPFEVMLSDVRRIYSILGYIVNQSGEARLITP